MTKSRDAAGVIKTISLRERPTLGPQDRWEAHWRGLALYAYGPDPASALQELGRIVEQFAEDEEREAAPR